MRRVLVAAALAAALAFSFPAPGGETLALDGPLVQGALVIGRAPAGARVTLDGAPMPVAADGMFLIGFGRDHPAEAVLEVVLPDGAAIRRALAVERRRYEVQRVDGLPQRLVTPDAEGLRRIAEDRARIAAARARVSAEPLFGSGFAWPARGPVTGVFGSQRILNGEARAPHNGVDVAAAEGDPVLAIADGVVVLAETDMVLTGRTVLLDHGLGLTSVYLHLSAIEVRPGERVAKGGRIGRVGATGRVTAAHLHWGVHLGQTALDPALVAGPAPD